MVYTELGAAFVAESRFMHPLPRVIYHECHSAKLTGGAS
jgi:hypothetical protein